jgi:cysteine desulfurase
LKKADHEGGASLYFDHAATTPPYPEALERFIQIHQHFFANPSSPHELGKAAKRELEALKERFCHHLSFYDGLFIQTASATESNNMVVHSFLQKHPEGKIYIGIDTHASLWYITSLQPERCQSIPLDQDGQYDFKNLNLEDQQAKLILLNTVSQDLGTLHNTTKWNALVSNESIHLHLDATQAFGKIPIHVDQLSFHSMSASAHKFGGTRGCGLLLLRDTQLTPLIHGGQQEDQLRAGTENVAALAAAECAYTLSLQQHQTQQLKQLDQALIEGLKKLNIPFLLNQPSSKCPGLNSISFPGYQGSELVRALSLKGICVATGSACNDSKTTASRAILAFGRSEHEGLGSLRISFGPQQNTSNVTTLLSALKDSLKSLSPS